MMTNSYIPERALAIYAHPDDIEFGVAGTTALWAKHGAHVRYIVITDGNIGSQDPTMTQERLAKIRRAEQTKAAEIAGCEVTFLGYPDGMLQPTLELRRDLVREIRRMKPNAVICGDPTLYFPSDSYINHPDHRAAATAALEACFPAPDSPLIFPELIVEGFEPCNINYVYISRPTTQANYWVDISETLETKLQALQAHECQLAENWERIEPMIRQWSAETGKEVGVGYAEKFLRITLKEPEESVSAA